MTSVSEQSIALALKNLYKVADRIGIKKARKMVKKFDKDDNGKISVDELKKWNKKQSEEERFDFESPDQEISAEDLEAHLIFKMREKIVFMVEKIWYEKKTDDFVQKTLQQAGARLRCSLKLSDAKGKDAFMDAIHKPYRTDEKIFDETMGILNFELENQAKGDLIGDARGLMQALNFQIDKTTDDLMAEKDADGSGFLHSEEHPDLDFSEVDKDASGFVSETELRGWHTRRMKDDIKAVLDDSGNFEKSPHVNDAWKQLNDTAGKNGLVEFPKEVLRNYLNLEDIKTANEMMENQIKEELLRLKQEQIAKLREEILADFKKLKTKLGDSLKEIQEKNQKQLEEIDEKSDLDKLMESEVKLDENVSGVQSEHKNGMDEINVRMEKIRQLQKDLELMKA